MADMCSVPSVTNVTVTSPPISDPMNAVFMYRSSADMLALIKATVPMKTAAWKTYQKRMLAAAGESRRKNGHVTFAFLRSRDLENGIVDPVKHRARRRPSLDCDVAVSREVDAVLIRRGDLAADSGADETGLDQVGLYGIGVDVWDAGKCDQNGSGDAHDVTSVVTGSHIAPGTHGVKIWR